ncbi:MAG: flippase-like domain-containing protein [Pseudomonadales bacterium]|nr:flippase-like domain-containing protein [Pseudomonadales bacterium]
MRRLLLLVKKHLLRLIKIALAVAALILIYNLVDWHDSYSVIATDGEVQEKVDGKILGAWNVDVVHFLVDGENEPRLISRSSAYSITPSIFTYLRNLDKSLFGLGAVSFLFFVLIINTRWWWLLRANKLGVRLLEAQRFGWIGLFCSNAMPGSVGGDLIKAVYIVERCSGNRFRAVVSILVDRIIGLLSLLLACSIGCLFIVTRFPEFAWTVWICALGVFVGCILLLSPGLRSILRFEMLISRLPKRLGKFVAQLDDAVLQYRDNLKGIGLWLLASPLIYSLFIGSVILMAQAIGVGLPWIDYLSIVPAAMVVQAVPIMPAGWGIGELAYGTLIAEFGAETLPGVPDAEQIMRTRGVALSVVHRIHVIAWSLLGGLLMLWDRQLHRNK